MSKEDYNSGLDTAYRIVEEMMGGTSEGETILCGIECSKISDKDDINDLSYKTEYEKLLFICSKIYYSRIAMNEEDVKNGLKEIDSYFRTENLN
jgi:hypothetical protein